MIIIFICLSLYFESNWDVLLNIKFYFIFIKTDLKKFCLLWGGYGKIVLASGSPRRSELLKQIGLDFEIVLSDIDESNEENLKANELVQHLAYKRLMMLPKKWQTERTEGKIPGCWGGHRGCQRQNNGKAQRQG